MNKIWNRGLAVICTLSFLLVLSACSGSEETQTTRAATAEETITETSLEETTEESTEAGNAPAQQSAGITSESSAADIAAYYNEVMRLSRAANTVRGSLTMELLEFQMPAVNDVLMNQLSRLMPDQQMMPEMEALEDLTLPLDDSVALLPEDIKSFEVIDSGDTLTLKIVPHAEETMLIEDGVGPHGRSLGAMADFDDFDEFDGAMEPDEFLNNGMISFAGDPQDSFSVIYDGGYLEIVVDKATSLIQSGAYVTVMEMNVTDCKIMGLISIDSACAKMQYIKTYA
ncbi:MAG: hypothetical protein LIO46_04130 [Clostridiales bacterium]|nr:hypothetical protein [Clostridiales bacterium]